MFFFKFKFNLDMSEINTVTTSSLNKNLESINNNNTLFSKLTRNNDLVTSSSDLKCTNNKSEKQHNSIIL